MDDIKLILDRLDRIENKIDSIGCELNKNIVNTTRIEEQTKYNEEKIEDLKKNTIPQMIKSGNRKLLNIIYGAGVSILISIILSVVSYFK